MLFMYRALISNFVIYSHSWCHRLPRYSMILLTTNSMRWHLFMHSHDGLLAEKDEKLSFARHVVNTLQHFHFDEGLEFNVFMRKEKVHGMRP